MNLMFGIFLTGAILACNVDNSDSVEMEYSELPDYWDSGYDTSEPLRIAETGTWHVSNSNAVSDSCGVAEYQDVKEMVPSKFKIEESSRGSFNTDSTECAVNQAGIFICNPTRANESALGGTATLKIKTTMGGELLSEYSMNLNFDVIIESCEGAGCFMIEMALNFPCPITLNATGEI